MGPLAGMRVIEMAGIGPGPFCAMMLADMGADVIRIDRSTPRDLGFEFPPEFDFCNRGRRSAVLDLKTEAGAAALRKLARVADALIEGFRPGVMERLGLGPDELLADNPRLVYGRVTGWGQDGPLARSAGHDINYIALTGMLDAIGPAAQPVPPLNLLGDYAGGGMYLAFGVLCALLECTKSGKGQVVDAAMVDGVASLGTAIHAFRAAGAWRDKRADNFLDSGAPWYGVYETADGKHVSIGSLEPAFYTLLLDALGLDRQAFADRTREQWPRLREAFSAAFRTRTREQWCALMEGSDICFAPVMSLAEAPSHPHLLARETFTRFDGQIQPAPAPRFSRTPPELTRAPAAAAGEHTAEVLADWGFSETEIQALLEG
jgi:alpha-methylacyl-CoA racemase